MPLATTIADSLRRGATVVAASPRAARALQLQYAEDQRNLGRQVWPAPLIVDWDSWLRELWRGHAFAHPDAPVLLSPLQERTVWTRVQSADAALVVSPESMAALAMDAWSLLSAFSAHSARRTPWAAGEQTDPERFRQWAAAFERECARQNWISFSQLPEYLTADAGIVLPTEILLVGFDRIAPAQRELLASLAARGLVVGEFAPSLHDPDRQWIAATHVRDEIAACARWARGLLAENPAVRIGVIALGIDKLRGPIDRTFRRILMPASDDIRNPSIRMPWEFSLGQPLAGIPVVRAACLLLRWLAHPLPETEISWLLLSGFVAGTVTNALAVARHDAEQRRPSESGPAFLRAERSLADYNASLAANPGLGPVHNHLSALLRAVAANKILDQSRPPSVWTDLIARLLETAVWPGSRTPDSVQFQALQRWQRLLDDLALLDFDGTLCTYSDFLAQLESHARDTIFSPESHDAPIQIMGPFESSGQQFDAVWFLGTDDLAWPQRGRLHPLLPAAVQRRFAMPHSTPEADWNLAHIVTARLLASAPRIVFSYAQREKDEEFRPSPLIAGLFAGRAALQLAAAPDPEPPAAALLQPIPDGATAPPWPSEQHAGGADVLRRQSACPFQAFAVKRLAAEPLGAVEWGLDPAQTGKLLHAILERIFQSIHSKAELVTAIDTNQLPGQLETAIDAFLAPFSSSDPWQQSYLDAERRRLRSRLTEWFACEAQRQPFTVEDCEKVLPGVHIGGLLLDLRADRIDLLPDGSRLILDYKTGDVSSAAWRGDRPEEPQLPLYAAFGNVENLSGILFAKIRAGKTGFDGRVRNAQDQLCSTLKSSSGLVREPYSDSMRNGWARVLENLAGQFLHGEAAVAPRDAKVCDHCHLHGLCRIAELNPAIDTEDEVAGA